MLPCLLVSCLRVAKHEHKYAESNQITRGESETKQSYPLRVIVQDRKQEEEPRKGDGFFFLKLSRF